MGLWQDLDNKYKDINPIGQIVIGIGLLVVGGGVFLLLIPIGHLPPFILISAGTGAAFGAYSIVRGIASVPVNRQLSSKVRISFTGAELMAIIDLIRKFEVY